MSKHLHRIASPKIYPILKKASHYVVKLNPGPHPKDKSLPLMLILRDLLKITKTAKESKRVLNLSKVKIDQKVRKEGKFPVGLMDVVTILDKNYRFIFDNKGKVKLIEISEKEANTKPCKIKYKKIVKGGKIQLNLHDGRTVLVDDNKYKPGDTIVIELPGQKIKEHLPFGKGMLVYISDGKHIGEMAKVVEFKPMPGSNPDKVMLSTTNNETTFETLKKYTFVIGKEKPEINLSGEESD